MPQVAEAVDKEGKNESTLQRRRRIQVYSRTKVSRRIGKGSLGVLSRAHCLCNS
jgi:hypothetical protein